MKSTSKETYTKDLKRDRLIVRPEEREDLKYMSKETNERKFKRFQIPGIPKVRKTYVKYVSKQTNERDF